jgi:hypothetical protein
MKYPIGIQDFRKIREGDYHYIDKTELIYELLSRGSNYFLTRPRRFGKSLLISTIKEIFRGSRDLFKDLWIEDKWDWDTKYLAVDLDFTQIDFHNIELAQWIIQKLNDSASEIEINLEGETLKEQFEDLLQKSIRKNKRVVLLIEGYDQPILDCLSNFPLAQKNQETLRHFYAVVKHADPYLGFLLVTGSNKFSELNLLDISFSPMFHDLLGITQTEMELTFAKELNDIALKMDLEKGALLEQIKSWYGGYNWGCNKLLYHPHALLNFFQTRIFEQKWFKECMPHDLGDLIQSEDHRRWDSQELIALFTLFNFDILHPDPTVLLFHAGYLTIAELNVTEGWCRFDYPIDTIHH